MSADRFTIKEDSKYTYSYEYTGLQEGRAGLEIKYQKRWSLENLYFISLSYDLHQIAPLSKIGDLIGWLWLPRGFCS